MTSRLCGCRARGSSIASTTEQRRLGGPTRVQRGSPVTLRPCPRLVEGAMTSKTTPVRDGPSHRAVAGGDLVRAGLLRCDGAAARRVPEVSGNDSRIIPATRVIKRRDPDADERRRASFGRRVGDAAMNRGSVAGWFMGRRWHVNTQPHRSRAASTPALHNTVLPIPASPATTSACGPRSTPATNADFVDCLTRQTMSAGEEGFDGLGGRTGGEEPVQRG